MDILRTWTLLIALAAAVFPTREAAAAPFQDTLAQRLQACTACHGDQGRAGPDGYYPRLAGKPAGYLYNQLINFKTGRRHYGLMTGLVDSLSDDYLMQIAQYFSALDLPYPKAIPAQSGSAALARGQRLATQGDQALGIPACTQCHGTALTGVLPQAPGLLGLPRDYLNAQLGGWKTGQRHAAAPDCMGDIARKLSDADVNAVTQWLSSQQVPVPSRPAPVPPALPGGQVAVQCGPQRTTAASAQAVQEPPLPAQVQQGAYLAKLGNCAACHTARGGAPFAGGLALDTAFGRLYTSNITPHPSRGIGAWSPADFWQAMHHGKSRDGTLLYPAFPYTNFTQISRADSDALLAFLKTVAPSDRANTRHELRWPYSTQWALAAWRWLYFKPAAEIAAAPAASDTLRGAYLVNSLGHCNACHTPRNALGSIEDAKDLVGAEVPGTRWWAPALQPDASGTALPWSQGELLEYLQSGRNAHAVANGPMAEVVLGSTQYLSPQDAQAIARYLLPTAAPAAGKSLRVTTMRGPTGLGPQLYEKHCATCHGAAGQGVPGAYPALAGNATVNARLPNNMIQITTLGGFAPATPGNPRPFGMPPFQLQLNNQELAALLSFVRAAWGNTAPAVSEFDINKLRPFQSP